MQARDGKSEFVGSSRTCFRSRRRQLLASRRHARRLRRWRRHNVEKQGEASAGLEAASGVQERHVARRKAARGQLGLRKWSARVAGSRARAKQGRGLEVDEGGPSCNFPKVQGPHYKT
ncbi:hypothetical protein PAHAL_7G065700 [Panicum hallii]|uniref:Uncharacterized protein n=1 Tax=Panicum hallii TaxID=206008 RepID=A0A2T8IB85_9POAL|nr:hypothetical protein PAHAL_7G065700 [Panicum hallii]